MVQTYLSRPQRFPSCCTFQVVDASVVLVVLARPRSCRQRQFAPKAGYAGYDAPRLCSSWLSQAKIFGILAGMDQKDSCSGIYKAGIAGDNAPRAVFSSLVGRPMMFDIMAVYGPEGQLRMLPMFKLLKLWSGSSQLASDKTLSRTACTGTELHCKTNTERGSVVRDVPFVYITFLDTLLE